MCTDKCRNVRISAVLTGVLSGGAINLHGVLQKKQIVAA